MSGDQPDALGQLEARVDALEDRQEQLEQGAVDARGRKWTLSDFLSMGLTRRQAMGVLGSLAAGMTLSGALTQTVLAQPDGDPGVMGQQNDRLDAWIDQMDANVVDTDDASIGTDVSAGVETRGTFGNDGHLLVSNVFNLGDDAVETISSDVRESTFLLFVSSASGDDAIYAVAGSSISIVESSGPWATSDSDGNNCLFYDSPQLQFKNRLGSPTDYEIVGLSLGT